MSLATVHGECLIECYSHFAREKALHDYGLKKAQTISLTGKQGHTPISFIINIIRPSDGTKLRVRHLNIQPSSLVSKVNREQHAIFYQNSYEGTSHHKVISDFGFWLFQNPEPPNL